VEKRHSRLDPVGEFLIGKAAKAMGGAGRKLFGLPVHLAVPIALAFGVALVVLASRNPARRQRRPAGPRDDVSGPHADVSGRAPT
jgi:hypothetical protein